MTKSLKQTVETIAATAILALSVVSAAQAVSPPAKICTGSSGSYANGTITCTFTYSNGTTSSTNSAATICSTCDVADYVANFCEAGCVTQGGSGGSGSGGSQR